MRHKAFLCAAIASALMSFACVASADEYTDTIAKLSVPPRASVRAAAWDGSSARAIAPDANGTFGITNEAELAWLATDEARNVIASLPRPTFEFMADLDLGGHEFTPIRIPNGSALLIRFNGNGHVIRGLRITGEHDKAALFVNESVSAEVEVSDQHLVDLYMDVVIASGQTSSGTKDVGSIIDSMYKGDIERCTVAGNMKVVCLDGSVNVGGIVGNITDSNQGSSANIKECVSDIAITVDGANASTGGLVGYARLCEFDSCATFGSITSNGIATGGFVGQTFNGSYDTSVTVRDSINRSSVILDPNGAGTSAICLGGFIGYANYRTFLDIESSVNYGIVKASGVLPSAKDGPLGAFVGGHVGSVDDQGYSKLSINRSSNFGAITNDASSTSAACVFKAGAIYGSLDSHQAATSAAAPTSSISYVINSGAISCANGDAAGMIGGATNINTDFDNCFTNLRPIGGGGDDAQPSQDECAVLSNARDIEDAIDKDGFDDISAFSIKSACATRVGDTVSISIVEFPDASVRNTNDENITYTVTNEAGDEIAKDIELTNGAITIPAANGDTMRVTITINDEKTGGDGRDVKSVRAREVDEASKTVSLVIANDEESDREIKAINVRGVPVTASENSTSQLYIEWIDADGVAHSTDRAPSEMPNVSWSIVAPNDAGWDVSVTPLADPFKATLTIGSKKTNAIEKCQEFAVRASLSYDGEGYLVYARKFFAGSFATRVTVGPEQQEMIDSANAVLAQTQVSILPGNFQDPIPAHILEMIAQRIEDGLEEYAAADEAIDRRAAAEKVELKPLYDLETIKSMTVEEPEIDTIPVCFKTTGKNSANITLDLARGGLGGEIVLLPMTYSVTFDSEKLDEFFGDAAESVLDDPTSDENIARIFDVLVLHKRIKEGAMKGWYTRLVDGVASPAAARDLGMLDVSATDDDGARELTVRLAYNVINCSGESFYVNDPDVGYLILPDGAMNDTLIDPLWSNAWDRPANNGVGGGSGGGCAAGASVIAIAAFAISRRRR